MMKTNYQILLVEDSLDDAEIIRYELKKSGMEFSIDRVDTEETYRTQLDAKAYDIILSDFSLPQFSGRRALELLMERERKLPFILVSGAVGDEIAVEMLRSGCVDYVLKERLTRLPSAVERAIQESHLFSEKQTALDALKESELRFRRIADNSPMLIWMSDINRKTNYVNATWCQFTGRSFEDEVTNGWLASVHPDDHDICHSAFRNAFEQRTQFTCEYRLRYHDGSYRWVIDTGTPNYLPNGEFIGFLGSCIDITERKRSEEQLRDSEQKFRSLFDNHSAVKLLIDPESGAILDANKSAVSFYGWSHDELTSKKIYDINTLPVDHVMEYMKSVILHHNNHFMSIHRRKMGTERYVDEFSNAITVGGKPMIFSIIHDITDKIRSEEQLRLNNAALQSAVNAIMISDAQGRILWANPAFLTLTGYSHDEIVGKNPRDISRSGKHPDGFYEGMWRTILAGEVWQGELINRRKDGSVYFEEQTITPLINEHGTVTHFIAIKQDITQRKQMEDSLRRSNDMFDKFFHQSLDACFFMELKRPIPWSDRSHRDEYMLEIYETAAITKLNAALLSQFLITREEVVAMNPKQIFDAEFDKVKALFTQLFDSGATYYSTSMKRDADQSDIVVEGNAVCIYDEEGRITGFFGIQRDVTQSIKEREELLLNQDRYKKFFEEDMTGDFISKPDGTLVMCNHSFAKMFGFESVQSALNVHAGTLYSDPDERTLMLKKLKEDKKIDHHILHGKRLNGQEFVALMTAIAHFNDAGEIIEIVGYITDDTRRKEMEMQMIQAQKMESIGELASGVAHDFNNILNNIYGFSQQLIKYHSDPSRVLRYSDTIAKSAQRGTEIASKLLSFARQKKTETTVLSLTDVVNDVVQMCNDTFLHTIAVKAQMDPLLWKVQGERSGLYQMMLNICMNARDALGETPDPAFRGMLTIDVKNRTTPHPGLHWFRNSVPSQYVEIIISDNGPGISQQNIDKIFDPFFSTKKLSTQKGTGLGLTVVYNMVKSHQGAITVKSELGKGTAFHIFLPAVEYATNEAAGIDSVIFKARNNETILLVDDEEGMRELGRELLEENGFNVLTAMDGYEALNIFQLKKDSIDLVILDLVMPGMDGGQTYLHMKKMKPDIKAFFCSGYVTDSLISNMLSEENLGALQKPFRPAQFVRFVHSVLYP
jgi:two-component system cell cycle sensor histidine kinase/response regulator CckA